MAIQSQTCLVASLVTSRDGIFFSSRRRHTISYGDWSSDVCSSDLACAEVLAQTRELVRVVQQEIERPGDRRSEERRVGKEGGSRWLSNEQTNARAGLQIEYDGTRDAEVIQVTLVTAHSSHSRVRNY